MDMMRIVLCSVACLLLAGCVKDLDLDGASDQDLFEAFNHYMVTERYSEALSVGQAIVQTYPASQYANDIKVGMLAAYHKNSQYDVAIEYADRLLASNLLDEEGKAEVLYQKIISKVRWSQHWMALRLQFLGVKDKYRNTQELASALQDMKVYLKAFPQGEHYQEIVECHHEIESFLAQQELEIAEGYAKKGDIKAAKERISRCQELYPSANKQRALSNLRRYPGIELTTGMTDDFGT